MSWPLASQFSVMLQNPRIAFRDAELRDCLIEKDERNQPRPWSGAFAVVYKGTSADLARSFAIRLFTTESPERRERYDLISAYLKTRRLNCLIDFEYRDRSIRSAGDGKWYPLILMEWVEGDTLFKWVRSRSMTADTAALSLAAEHWLELVRELADAGIAHGDLQHGNVMITDAGELKLVDYDGMCVPALAGRRNLEVGVAPYQHPDRNERSLLSPTLDRFSALVIYVALRALAADPALWGKYVEGPSHDKLLFRSEDFRAPAASPLYQDLQRSPDEQVREMAGKLFGLARVPMDQMPPLGEVAYAFAKIERLLRGEQWEEAVHALNRRGRFRDAPEALKPLIQQAYEHVCRQKAWQEFQKVVLAESEACDGKLLAAWNEALFAGFAPAEERRRRVELARQRIAALESLAKLAAQSPKPSSFAHEAKLVLTARRLPKDYRYALHARVQQARLCVGALQQLEAAIDKPSAEAAIDTAWRRVVLANCEALVRPELKPRIELARKRVTLLDALKRLPPRLPQDQLDRYLLEIWNEDLLKDCLEADAWRDLHQQAHARHETLGRLEQAVRLRDEADIDRLMGEHRLDDYPLPAAWLPTIQLARERVARCESLLGVLRNGERAAFRGVFDARVVRGYPERFSAWREMLCQWIDAEILPAQNLGLRPAIARASLVVVDRAQGVHRVCWTWPQQRFADECFLAVCPERPCVGQDPRGLNVPHRFSVDRQSWESGGGSRLIHATPQWQGCYLVVWALVDVGFRTFASHPLVLGQFGERPQRAQGDGRGWHVFFRRGVQVTDDLQSSPAVEADGKQGGHEGGQG